MPDHAAIPAHRKPLSTAAHNVLRRQRRAQRTAENLDGRTRTARRRHQLEEAIVVAMGGLDGLDAITVAQIKRCAELTVACELMRPKLFAGHIDFVTATRLEGECRRAWAILRAPLKLPPEQTAPAGPPGPWRASLADVEG